MTLPITERAAIEAKSQVIVPQIVVQIDEIDDLFGAVPVYEYIRIGDPNLYIGNDWVIGGTRISNDSKAYLSFEGGTSTSINQQLEPDKGDVSNVSSLTLSFIDKNRALSKIISPSVVVDDILGRKAKVYFGFQNSGFPEDFALVFSGIIDSIDSGAGIVSLNVAHPDQKKRQELFIKTDHELDGAINNSVTTITLDSISGLLTPVLGPDGNFDPSIKYYVKIDNEIIRYTGVSGSDLTGCTRAQLGTSAASHSDGAGVSSFYVLEGDAMTLALKLMLSGRNDFYVDSLDVTSFNIVPGVGNVPNSVYFEGQDLVDLYNVVSGDYITTTGADQGANSVSAKEILEIIKTDTGTYLIIDGVTFSDEYSSPASASIRSKYDTLGEGLQMDPSQVDIKEHERLYQLFLSSFSYRFYLKDTIDGKDFIGNEIYKPTSAFSIPRKGKSSVGMHTPPLPNEELITLDERNIKNPDKIKLKRSIAKNFYNTILYRFEEDALEDDKFRAGLITQAGDSLTRVPVGTKAMQIDSKGMRKDLSGLNLAEAASNRRINRYKFGAEYFMGIEVFYGDGFRIEPGDVVLFDPTNLKITNTQDGTRDKGPKLFEVVNRSIDIKTGKVTLDIVDTQYDGSERYGLISPASRIKVGASQTQFTIESSFSSKYGQNEYKKWVDHVGTTVRVRNSDFSQNATATLTSASSNVITVSPALGFVPASGMIMEFGHYDDQTDKVKLVYTFMSDGSNDFADGQPPYVMV